MSEHHKDSPPLGHPPEDAKHRAEFEDPQQPSGQQNNRTDEDDFTDSQNEASKDINLLEEGQRAHQRAGFRNVDNFGSV